MQGHHGLLRFHQVPFRVRGSHKGVGEDRIAADMVSEDIVWLGHSRVLIRSDNEPALVALVNESLKNLRIGGLEQAAAEGSTPYDPQTFDC